MELVTVTVLLMFVAVVVRFLRAVRDEAPYEPDTDEVDPADALPGGFDPDQLGQILDQVFAQARRPERVERTGSGPWLDLPIGGRSDPLGPVFAAGLLLPHTVEQSWLHDSSQQPAGDRALTFELDLWHEDGRREPYATVRIPAGRFVAPAEPPLQVVLELDLVGNLSGEVSDPVLGTTRPVQVQLHAVAPVEG